MRWFIALLITAGLIVLMLVIKQPLVSLGIVVATAIWAAFDSTSLELHKYKSGINHPVGVFLGIFLLWVIFFPLYLVTRSKRVAGELKLKKSDEPQPRTMSIIGGDPASQNYLNSLDVVRIAQSKDPVREVFETIVFVVVLVLMLKLFVVEAFVIPTGSMAETLYGYNKIATCPQCGYEFPVNASNEVEPSDGGPPRPVTGACCPNCRHRWEFPRIGETPDSRTGDAPDKRSGDRVLVLKPLYNFREPEPGDVVVFKYPVDPQTNQTAQNYIKRLWGRGDDTIAVHNGDLYVAHGLAYPVAAIDQYGQPQYPRPDDEKRAWEGPNPISKTTPPYQTYAEANNLNLTNNKKWDFTYHNVKIALDEFEASRTASFPGGPGKFAMIRKSDALALSMRRIVYDNDHQAKSLNSKGVPARWNVEEAGWKSDSIKTPTIFTHSGNNLDWVRYRHRVSSPPTQKLFSPDKKLFDPDAKDLPDVAREWKRGLVDDWFVLDSQGAYTEGLFPPGLITNYLGYNGGVEAGRSNREGPEFWVGDLMLECTAKVSGPADEVVLELSRSVNRFQARFANGKVTLVRTGPNGKEMASAPTSMSKAGTYQLRFANFDGRLRVWVDGDVLDFGSAADYTACTNAEADAQATLVGTLAGAAAHAIFAPRADQNAIQNDVVAPASIGSSGSVEVSKIRLWQDTFFTPSGSNPAETVDTFYVQPKHYLCLGDNSGQSSDGRMWGLVPERLMLGKAVFIFWPWRRIGFIR